MLPLGSGQEFNPASDEDFFTSLPSRPGVLLLEMTEPGAQPYLARTADIRRAAERLLREPDPLSKRLNLRQVAARIRYRVTSSKFEQTLTLYEHAKLHFPRRYRDLLRLRPPALLKVNLRNEYPRCYVTRQISADEGFYFGPFSSRRAADAFAESFLDLFKIRRCQIKIRRDPSYPGCIYSEMKMCLAPCFAGCTKEEYDVETGRVLATLESTGASLTEQLERDREAASESQDYERAAALHKRLEKVSAALRGMPEVARRIEELDAVILQRTAEEMTIAVFPVHAGLLAEPIFLRFAEFSSQPRSVEAILRKELEPQAKGDETSQKPEKTKERENILDTSPQQPLSEWRARYGLHSAPAEMAEHLTLLARWFYSKPREGEIFFREADWPYRRILRACGRLLGSAEPTQFGSQPSG
ncbi:MAG TPA: UvrB/UvrC motif-containing protein [Candidatus Limnocylindria bacterium]|nr:UvrB/UvrC motif-containing protein [Candidatus Limnocylindria bacterium]